MAIFVICITIYFCINAAAGQTNFHVKHFELCNNTQGIIKYYGNITKERDGNQYLTLETITPVDWDDNLGLICLIESMISEKHAVEICTIKEKNMCKAAKTYMGEFWYDLLRAEGQFNPKACPLPKGHYHIHHFLLNFDKLTLRTFPFGILRFTMRGIDNKNPQNNMGCFRIIIENVIN